MDRIDLHIEVHPVKYDELDNDRSGENSVQIKKRVNAARSIQIQRYRSCGIYCNSQLSSSMIKKYCRINDDSRKLLKSTFERLGLSARAYSRILKIARTTADLDGREDISTDDIAESIQYRSMDRKYWEY